MIVGLWLLGVCMLLATAFSVVAYIATVAPSREWNTQNGWVRPPVFSAPCSCVAVTVSSLHLDIVQPVLSLFIIDLLDVERPEMVELLKRRLSQMNGRTEHDMEVWCAGVRMHGFDRKFWVSLTQKIYVRKAIHETFLHTKNRKSVCKYTNGLSCRTTEIFRK